MEWVFPRSLTKPHPDLFGKKYFDVKELRVKHFSSDVLNIIVILDMFMQLILKPKGLLLDHCHCFNLLHRIIVLLQTSQRHIDSTVVSKFCTASASNLSIFRDHLIRSVQAGFV